MLIPSTVPKTPATPPETTSTYTEDMTVEVGRTLEESDSFSWEIWMNDIINWMGGGGQYLAYPRQNNFLSMKF